MLKNKSVIGNVAAKGAGAFFLLCAVIVLYTPTEYVTEGLAFSVVPFAAAAVICMAGGYKRTSYDRKLSVIAFVLSLLFLVQLSIFEIIGRFDVGDPVHVILLAGFSISLVAAVYSIVYSFLAFSVDGNRGGADDTELKRIGFLPIYYLSLPVIIVTAFFMFAFVPPYIHPDFGGMWEMLSNGEWSEWHTMGYSLFVKIASLGNRSEYSLVLVQGVFWIIVCNYGIGVLYRSARSKKICFAHAVTVAAIFSLDCYSCIMVKDFMYSACMYLFVLAFIDALNRDRIDLKTGLILSLSGLGTAVFRHMGWASVLTTLLAWLIYSVVRKKDAIKVCAVILAVLSGLAAINGAGPRLLHAEKNPAYVKYSIPMYMIGAVSCKVDDIPEEDLAVMNEVCNLGVWRVSYMSNRFWADTLSRTWGPIGDAIEIVNDPEVAKDILKLNLKWLFRYPKEYLSSYFDITSMLWEMGRPTGAYEWTPMSVDFPGGNAATETVMSVADMSAENKLINPVFWRGGFWLFSSALAIIVLLLKRLYKYLIAVLAPVMAVLLLFLGIPAQDARYILFFIQCGEFLLYFAAFAGRGQGKGELTSEPVPAAEDR